MAYSYNKIGDLSLPKIYVPTWFKIEDFSENNDALLNLDLLTTDAGSPMYNINDISDSIENSNTKILNLGGISDINNIEDNIYKDIIIIGLVPPRQGSIIAYSNDINTVLEGTNSAHILSFEHSALHHFNFAILENHVIQRIEKLYRSLISFVNYENNENWELTRITKSDTEYDMPDTSTFKMIINSINEPDAIVIPNTTTLILIEGGH